MKIRRPSYSICVKRVKYWFDIIHSRIIPKFHLHGSIIVNMHYLIFIFMLTLTLFKVNLLLSSRSIVLDLLLSFLLYSLLIVITFSLSLKFLVLSLHFVWINVLLLFLIIVLLCLFVSFLWSFFIWLNVSQFCARVFLITSNLRYESGMFRYSFL